MYLFLKFWICVTPKAMLLSCSLTIKLFVNDQSGENGLVSLGNCTAIILEA